MSRDHGKAFGLKAFANGFGEAFDLRGFAKGFCSAFDLGNAAKSFAAGIHGGSDLINRQLRGAAALVRLDGRHRHVHGQLVLQRLLADVAGGGGAAARALREIRDLMRPYNPRVDAIPDDHLPGLVKRIIGDLQKPAARPEDFAGAVGRALADAQGKAAELAFADAAQVLDAALAQTGIEDQERARGRAALLAERGRVARLQLRYREAAGFYEHAAETVAFASEMAWNYLVEAASAHYAQGEEFGENTALEDAIAIYRSVLNLIPRERASLQWAATQNDLGIALERLGERESGTVRLEEAVSVYREALTEFDRARMPLNWARAQSNLGGALKVLGERQSSTLRLKEAVVAHRAALTVLTRERVPLDWATAQNNLGNALSSLGQRESGAAKLEEAIAAFRESLKELTRERVPLQWAMIQTNLGSALGALGERENDTERLQEAIIAFRAALTEQSRKRVPLDWAMTQCNLGTALECLGERENGTARLEEAVAAFRAALTENTRDRAPMQWAITQNNIGNALAVLGERESGMAGQAHLREAIATYDAAFEVFVTSGATRYAEGCRANRERTLQLLETK